jgi:predicted alpha-1,2-mannosidase
MRLRRLLFLPLVIAFSVATGVHGLAQSVTQHVNPLIGTAAGGNVYPGAVVPFGMMSLTPNTDELGWGNMGYRHENRHIIGFVHNQVSGVGCGEFGNFLIMPTRRPFALGSFGYKSERTAERAEPAYYTTRLTRHNVTAELTATARTGHHRYTFHAGKKGDTLSIVFNAAKASHPQWATRTETRLAQNGKHVSLFGEFTDGFGSEPLAYSAWFAATCSETPAFVQFWKDSSIVKTDALITAEKQEGGVILNFISDGTEKVIELTCALSYRTAATAEQYLASHKQSQKSFDAVRAESSTRWASLLDKIKITGASAEQQTIFYTALYHGFIMPTDITGETPDGFRTSGKAFTNYFAVWDIYRTLSPLLTLLAPSIQRDLLNGLLDIADRFGWLPDGFTGNAITQMQGGSNADVLFADAIVKKVNGVDYERAYHYMMKNATQSGDAPGMAGRKGRYTEYLQNGWLAADKQWCSVSKALEYAYNDYCVWVMANDLGKNFDAEIIKQRSLKIFTYFDSTTGFLRPKLSSGKWVEPFYPSAVFPPGTEWSYEVHYQEGSAWQYLGYVPHDFYGLISRLGGARNFVAKWDTLFERRSGRNFTKGFYSTSNEPDMLAPWQYIYAGRADRTQYWVRKILSEDFTTTSDGLPGNDDAGTTSAWAVWAMLGLFPNAGQDWYFIGSPVFKEARLTLENGNELILSAPRTSEQNIYIRSLTLNGKKLNRAYLYHHEIANGATLEFDMTDTPTSFGNENTPPSPFGKPTTKKTKSKKS